MGFFIQRKLRQHGAQVRLRLELTGNGEYCIVEPFLAEWLRREERGAAAGLVPQRKDRA